MKYIDTNIFVYRLEEHPEYGSSCIEILQQVQDGKLKAVCSHIVLVELVNVLQKINNIRRNQNKGKVGIARVIDIILSYPIIWLEMDLLTIKKASEYKNNFLGIDRIHLATMELNHITEIITADKDFDNIPGIKRIDPLEYKTSK